MRPGTRWKRRTKAERKAIAERRRLAIFRMIRRDSRARRFSYAACKHILTRFALSYGADGKIEVVPAKWPSG